MARRNRRAGTKARSTALNKKILCFIDEHGTAGKGDLYLGAVLVLAREAGRVDKRFSDLLEDSANEIHAVSLDDGYLQGLMQRFWSGEIEDKVVLINQACPWREGLAAAVYADAVIATVKAGLTRFKKDVLKRETIGNVEVILDANHHNCDPLFAEIIAQAQAQDGRFRGVQRVSQIDSAASRLLQLADVVAASRRWIVRAEINAAGLRDRFGIQMP